MPVFDEDSGLLFVLGRGDTTLSLIDTTDKLSVLQRTVVSTDTSYGYALLPKPCLDVFNCEVDRLLNLTSTAVLPVGLHVPRRNRRELHTELFPPTASTLKAALSAEQWIAGDTALSLKSPVLELQYKIGKMDDFFEDAYAEYIPKETSEQPAESPDPSQLQRQSSAEKEKDEAFQAKLHEWLGYVPKFKNVILKEAPRDKTIYNLVGPKDDCFSACSSRFAVPFQGAGGRIYCAKLSSAGKVLAPNELPMLDAHTRAVLSLDFSPFDDRVLASGSDDYNICAWRLPEVDQDEGQAGVGQSVPWQVMEGHYAAVKLLKFHKSVGELLVSGGSGECAVKLWDVSKGQEVLNLEYASGM